VENGFAYMICERHVRRCEFASVIAFTLAATCGAFRHSSFAGIITTSRHGLVSCAFFWRSMGRLR